MQMHLSFLVPWPVTDRIDSWSGSIFKWWHLGYNNTIRAAVVQNVLFFSLALSLTHVHTLMHILSLCANMQMYC